MTDDNAAIEQCRAGDPDAFRPLVERYQRQAVAHAQLLVGHREDALDAVQEAFVDAYCALDRFDASRRFYPWFCVILRNRCFKIRDKRSKRPKTETLELADCHFIQSKRHDQQARQVNDALRELAPADREVILLKHIDGLTCNELAERLEIPRGTVMSRLYRARRRLREKLDA